MKHLKKYNNTGEYQDSNFNVPNISYIKEHNEIMYNSSSNKYYITYDIKDEGMCNYSFETMLIDNNIIPHTSLLKKLIVDGEEINLKPNVKQYSINCMSSQINLTYDESEGLLFGDVPLEYFTTNPTSCTIKSNNFNYFNENALFVFLVNEPELGYVVALPIPISELINYGYGIYNEQENSLILSQSFLDSVIIQYSGYSLSLLLSTVNLETGDFTFYDTTLMGETIVSKTYTNLAKDVTIYNNNSYISYRIPTENDIMMLYPIELKPLNDNISITNLEFRMFMYGYDVSLDSISGLDFESLFNINKTENSITISLKEINYALLLTLPLNFMLYECKEDGEIVFYDTICSCFDKNYYRFKTLGFHNVEVIPNDINYTPVFYNAFLWTLLPNRILTSIKFPNNVNNISDLAFYECLSLKEVKLPKNIEYMGEGLFYRCESLKSIELPKNTDELRSVNYDSNCGFFSKCSSLTSIKCNATIAPKIYENTFSGISPTGTLYYPNGSDYSSWIAMLPSGWKSETF